MSEDKIITTIDDKTRKSLIILLVTTYILMLLGGWVKAKGAGLSCPDWPLCYGSWFPFFDGNIYPYDPLSIFAEWFHRLVASGVGLWLLYVAYRTYRYRISHPTLWYLSRINLLLFFIQAFIGGLTVYMKLAESVVVLHLGSAILILLIELSQIFYTYIHSEGFISDFISKMESKGLFRKSDH